MPPVREHGTQVAVGSTNQESQPSLNVAELISSEAKALSNLLPPVRMWLYILGDLGTARLKRDGGRQ